MEIQKTTLRNKLELCYKYRGGSQFANDFDMSYFIKLQIYFEYLLTFVNFFHSLRAIKGRVVAIFYGALADHHSRWHVRIKNLFLRNMLKRYEGGVKAQSVCTTDRSHGYTLKTAKLKVYGVYFSLL